MTDDQWQTVRTVLAFRLINLPPSYIAAQLGTSEKAVQKILLDHGTVARRGGKHWWRGPFSISPETHQRFKMPIYIPMTVDQASYRVTNGTAWAAITRDAIVVALGDGKAGILGNEGVAEGFHPEQGGPSQG